MDAGNGPNQQQRYCPTPMAPPPVAASPPMSGGTVMNTLHQQPHHPPPSMSPHPGAYYGHHNSGTSHYPTPSPTPPPPMHHQQYYAHPYYAAHGSHQQAQQQQQQQQSQQSPHHAIANAHVPINTPPGSGQPSSQHAHMMSHASYHHPQSQQTHHQQWATHPHQQQQQSHHYYHQPTHHPPAQQPQQQAQQHGYPPPPHSPYAYVQTHAPAPTPPPPSHTPQHAQMQQHLQTNPQPQQHQLSPQVSVSPGPGQIHQVSQQQQQQPQNNPLMGLTRMVSQSPQSPSPRASPSLAVSHHPQQMQQMGPTSPSHYGGHMDHHSGMNGHTSNSGANNSPVMSPPPAPVPMQQPMSPVPVSQHHIPMPPQSPYSINGGDTLDRHSPIKTTANIMNNEQRESIAGLQMKTDSSSNPNKGPNLFSNISPSKIESFLKSDLSKPVTAAPVGVTKTSNSNSIMQNNAPKMTDASHFGGIGESVYPGISNPNPSPLPVDGRGTPEVVKEFGDSIIPTSGGKTASPPLKPMGSPSSSGNGHQMMPVRLQNMHKGARTKANMKKLMQEQQITTPNGQVTDSQSDLSLHAKDADGMDPGMQKQSPEKTKSPRKRKTQPKDPISNVAVSDLTMPMSPINMDLTGTVDSSVSVTPVVRPGYTKSGKKIGRPRKEKVPTMDDETIKPKKKRERKSSPKKGKGIPAIVEPVEPPAAEEVNEPAFENNSILEEPVELAEPPAIHVNSRKRKSGKAAKKSSKLSRSFSEIPQMDDAIIAAPVLIEEQLQSTESPVINEPVSAKGGGKKRRKKSPVKQSTSLNSSPVKNDGFESSPDVALLPKIPSSEISEQEAESVAKSIQYLSSTPVIVKGKRKGKKAIPVTPILKTVASPGTTRRSKGKGKVANLVEAMTSPERGELPRLRSRSPKQESPPLRVSSPRAAKERSTTPASTVSTTPVTAIRPRASREKETGSTVSTPLSSPSMRSPRKTPEKDKEKVGGRSTSRQLANESLHSDTSEAPSDLMSPPLSKRLRQLSRESVETTTPVETVGKKGRRKTPAQDIRLSTEGLEKTPPIANKRASRRKSGSVTSSQDNLSSPSFSQSSPSMSLIPSDSVADPSPDLSELERSNVIAQPPVVVEKRKRRKWGRAKGKPRKPVVAVRLNVSEALPPPPVETDAEAAVINFPPEASLPVPEVKESTIIPAAPAPVNRRKKSRGGASKKGKRRRSTAAAVPAELPVEPLDTTLTTTEEAESLVETDSGTPLQTVPSLNLVLKKPKGRKGAGKGKKARAIAAHVSSIDALNEPTVVVQPPTLVVSKKNVKFKPVPKGRKKKGFAAKTAVVAHQMDNLEEGNSFVNASMADSTGESVELEQNQQEQPPQVLSPGKRRRSSLLNATNTQVSAKLNSETEVFQKAKVSPVASASGVSPSSTSKALRRDSRSISRDYDVSVVLTDIVQTFTQGDTSLQGISTSLSRLQSPTNTSFIPVQSPPEQDSSVSNTVEQSVDLDYPPSSPSKKGKRQSKVKTDVESPSKKKAKIAPQPNQELQERKAILEAEVALVLLDLKTGTGSSSSKSPSPAKSVDAQNVISKKKTKSRKRKHSRSPRRSIDHSASIATEESLPVAIPLDTTVSTPGTPLISSTPHHNVVKGVKRKGAKGRRASNARKLKMAAASSALSLPTESDTSQTLSQSLNASNLSTIKKVGKTAVIPTASDIIDQSVATPKSKLKMEKKTPVKGKGHKKVVTSPDITAVLSAQVQPLAFGQKKMCKKRVSKKELGTDNSLQQSLDSVSPKVESTSQAEMTNIAPSTIPQVAQKKKRQRKGKLNVETPTSTEPIPSTSSAALTAQFPSSSKLFPHLISPAPYKKPTVFAKFAPITDSAKDDDNQKKKGQDAPMLKVIGGRAKFYRGGEVEEVDQDPKLPKEKAQLQTDNAVPWICSFCHLGPHAQKLGDLFGPYFANLPSIYGKPSLKRETWMHGDCALWAGRLLLIGTYLRRLEETLKDADKETCTVCGKNGATIGCLRRGCKEAVHYPCAVRKFWKMDEQNFHSYCPKHIP